MSETIDETNATGETDPARRRGRPPKSQMDGIGLSASSATETDELQMIPVGDVQRLVAEQVAAATAAMQEEFAKQFASLKDAFQPQTPASLGDKGAMEALALAIASVTDQEVGRKRVPPEEMARRVRANEKLEELIQQTRANGVQPVYSLTQKCYLGEQMIEPYWIDRATRSAKATEVGWWGIPNEFMHPVNEEAKAIHTLFLESVDSHKKRANVRITPGGLVVRSGGLNPEGGRDQSPRVGRDMNEPSLVGRNGDRPEVVTRILGTLMPAARQMV